MLNETAKGRTDNYHLGDVAISSASFVLVSSNLRSLITLRDLSKAIINRVRFNFVSSNIAYRLEVAALTTYF